MSQKESPCTGSNRLIKRCGLISLILIPILVYGYLLVRFSTNVPYMDDYGAILSSLLPRNAGLSHMFDLQNEHRIAWTRVVVRLFFITTGTINFRYLAYIGNSALLVLVGVYGLIFKYRRLPASAFIPVSWIMFATMSWENMTWAMASIQNYFSILFAIISMYLWSQKTWLLRFISAMIAAIATYTSGYGLMVFPSIVFIQFFDILAPKRHPNGRINRIPAIVHMTAVMIIATVIVGLYFVNFRLSLTESRLGIALAHPVKSASFMLCYLGSSVPGETIALSFAAGVIMVLLFFILIWKRYDRINPANVGLMIYVLLNSVVVALSRTAIGLNHALSSRYTIMSMLAIIFLYIGIIETWPALISRRSVIIPLIVAAIIFNALWLPSAVSNLSARQNALNDGIRMWCRTGQGLRHPNQLLGTRTINQSIKHGIYTPPCLPDIPAGEDRKPFMLYPTDQKTP